MLDFQNRRRFFDGLNVFPPGLGKLYTCPCCGYPTLKERRGDEICSLCSWEDDGQDDANADEIFGGPNESYSLTVARKNFEKYLGMFPPGNDPFVLPGPDRILRWESRRKTKEEIVKAFDAMRDATSVTDCLDLWEKAQKGFDKL